MRVLVPPRLLSNHQSPQEYARDDLEDETAEDDEAEEAWNFRNVSRRWPLPEGKQVPVVPSHSGEMGDFGRSLVRFLTWSSDLPMRASCSLANLMFARLCCGVCACRRGLLATGGRRGGDGPCRYHCEEVVGGEGVDPGMLVFDLLFQGGIGERTRI